MAESTTISRQLDCPPDDAWERLTSPDGFENWMGAGSTIEPHPGGELIAADPESGDPKIGRVLRVEPGELLHWVWRPLGGDDGVDPDNRGTGVTEVVIEVGPSEPARHPGTLITVTESPSSVGVPMASVASAVSCRSALVGV